MNATLQNFKRRLPHPADTSARNPLEKRKSSPDVSAWCGGRRLIFCKVEVKIALFFLLSLLAACSGSQKEGITPFFGRAMTIDWRIVVGSKLNSEQQRQIEEIISSTFNEVNSHYNKWNPTSELSQLNDGEALKIYPLSEELEKLLRLTDTIVALTAGRFDPTIEALQAVWKKALQNNNEPTAEEIFVAGQSVGWNKIHFAAGLFWKENSMTRLDLCGIAKGYCVDLLIERLELAGYKSLYVEWGGEIRTAGIHPAGRPWRVYISNLSETDPAKAIATVELQEAAIATSGDYLQNWWVGGTLYCHVMDAMTLSPVKATDSSVASASVKASSCALADGLATAAMLFSNSDAARLWAADIERRLTDVRFWILSRNDISIDKKAEKGLQTIF